MCRFVLYHGPPITLGSLVTEPENSLIHQSYQSRERAEPLNGDGFGLAWYAPELSAEPALFRSVSPAWNNANLLSLARVVRSHCILAHVRAATQVRTVSQSNCHPFCFGRYAFMHNGDVGGFAALRRPLLARLSDPIFEAIGGNTDSEHVFALFLEHVVQLGDRPEIDELIDAFQRTLQDVLELSERYGAGAPSYLNFALSDGQRALVSRYTTEAGYDGESLHLNRGRRYVCQDGVCRMLEPDHEGSAVMVSSEVLSEDGSWEVVPRNRLVVIDEARAVRILPL